MQAFSFSPGQRFKWNDVSYTIHKIIDGNRVFLETESQLFAETTLHELVHEYALKNLVFIAPNPTATPHIWHEKPRHAERTLDQFSSATQQASKRAYHYIIQLLEELGRICIDSAGVLKRTILEIANRLNDLKPPSPSTVYRWYRKYVRGNRDQRSLIYKFELRGGKGKRRCSQHVQELEDQKIEEIYLNEQRYPIKDVVDDINYQLKEDATWGKIPHAIKRSLPSVYRTIQRLEKPLVLAARCGVSHAKRAYRSDAPTPQLQFPLERVEIDHTPLDLFLVDEKTGLSLGRPTVTMGICGKTNMPWGLHVAFDDTSADSVVRCIAHGIKPKTYIKDSAWNIESEWPAFGIPNTIRADNGVEFHSADLKRVAQTMGFHLEFSPRRQPNWKPSIERFFRTLNHNFAHKLPGTSRDKYWKRTEEDIKAPPVIDLQKFNELLHRWLIDIYMLETQRSLGKSPYQAWMEEAR